MPDAKDVLIAKGVVTHLNGGSYSQTVTAVRSYVPQYALEDLDTLRVTVVARSITFARGSRNGANQYDHECQVGVFKRPPSTVTPDTAEEIAWVDGLRYLVEQLADRCLTIALTDPVVRCSEVRVEPTYAPEHLRERRQFSSVLILRFRLLV